MAVAEYIKTRSVRFRELIVRCVGNEKAARDLFRGEFGPTAIAKYLDDDKLKRGAVGKAPTYIKCIQPVIQGRLPEGIELPKGDDNSMDDIIIEMRNRTNGKANR